MPNRKISQLSTVANLANVWVPGYDLSRPSGDQNVKFAGAGLGYPPVVTTTLGITVAAGATTDVQLAVPLSPANDVTVLGLTLRSPTIAAAIYNLLIYAGHPGSGGALLFDYAGTFTVDIGSDGSWTYLHPTLLYLPASGVSNQLWARIISGDSDLITLSAQVITLEYPGHGIQLPAWVDPPPYTGPLLDEVFVGPTRQFIEPRFALAALNDGGTMHIDPGTYYYPFGMTWDATQVSHPEQFGFNANHPAGAARFVNGITIIGSGAYNTTPTIFNGRGGYGLQANHPFRMIHGQAFVWTNSPLTISDVRFMFCGGNDQTSDGEAGLYVVNFIGEPTTRTVSIVRCGFDGNENGIFTQFWHGPTPGETDISNATGDCRYLTMSLDHCDFGYLLPNGCAGDGGSHDLYINGMTLNIAGSHFYGGLYDWMAAGIAPIPLRVANTVVSQFAGQIYNPPTSGNCIKSRSRYVTVDGSWVRANSGKWIDRPDGGDTLVTNSVFSTYEESISLVLAYNTEEHYPIPLSDMVFQGCTMHFQREKNYGGICWQNTASNKFDFSDAGNSVIWGSTLSGIVFNRTNASYGIDYSSFSGFDGQYQEAHVSGGLGPSATATLGPPPPAPTPASLKAGDTLGPGMRPLIP